MARSWKATARATVIEGETSTHALSIRSIPESHHHLHALETREIGWD